MDAKVREVVPGIFLVHLPLPMKPTIVNVYLIHSGDEWVLVDTGMNGADSIAAFQSAAASVGCRLERLTHILCTHHHPDHFGASKTYKELTGATLYLHRAEYERSQTFLRPATPLEEVVVFFHTHGVPLQRFVNTPRPHEFFAGLYATAAPDVFIDDGDIIRVGDIEIEVIWTPGHAPGHCVMYLRRQRVMIAGDHLLPKITPHVGMTPGSVPNPLADFLDSQRKIQHLEVDLVLPAHGAVFADHRHRANQIIHHHESRLQEIRDAVRRQPRTAYDTARLVFAFDLDSPVSYQFPAMFETLAHLEYLRHQHRVEREEREGLTYYRAA